MMQLTYSLTEADILQARLLQTNIRRRALIMAALFATVMFVVELARNWDDLCECGVNWHWIFRLAAICLGGGVAFGLWMAVSIRYFALPRMCRRICRDNPAFFADIRVTLDEAGLEVVSPRQTTRTGWSDLRGMKENEKVLIICYSKTYAHVIPKQVLTPETEQQLRELLRARLPAAS